MVVHLSGQKIWRREIKFGKLDGMFITLLKLCINNGRVYSTDVCVPISKITECVKFAEEQAKKFGVRAPMVGHMGDGNFHVILPYDPAKKDVYANKSF